jgi:predicted DNA-binding protein (UPF0251 family)
MPHKDPETRREYSKQYQRAYKARNPEWQEKQNAKRREAYASDPKYRDEMREATKAIPLWVKAARSRVAKAIRSGRLVRPDSCEECGKTVFVEAAHLNYHDYMAIRWLCRSCHRRWDAENPKMHEDPGPRTWQPIKNVKLDREIYPQILKLYEEGWAQGEIGAKFGVSRTLIGQIVRGEK